MPVLRDRCRVWSGTRSRSWRSARSSLRLALVVFLHAATGATAPAVPHPSVATSPESAPRIDVQRITLPNGLRVVLAPDRTTPTVTIDMLYDVGGRNEERGRSGLARLLEHLMFQGSKNVPQGAHAELVAARGGTTGAAASDDGTHYATTLPSSELALGLWLEADRMKWLDVSRVNVERQRAVVEEAYRMRLRDVPYAAAAVRLQSLVYRGYWPYEHSAVGSPRDLAGARLDWARGFHDAYYAPDNAVLAIAGDVDPTETVALVKRYFGDARREATRPAFTPPPLPAQTEERTAVVVDDHAELAALLEGWAVPKAGDKDHDALILAAMILADGESSRLHRALVRERALAARVSASTSGRRGPDTFELTVHVASGTSVPLVKKLVEAQLAELARSGPTDDELLKVRRRFRTKLLFGLQSNRARAQAIAEREAFQGDAALVNDELERFLSLGKGDIQRAVGAYLTTSRRNVVEVRPGTEARR